MPSFTLRCLAVLDPAVRHKLDERPYFDYTVGAAPVVGDEDKRIHFDVDAADESSALEEGHAILSAAGANLRPSDLEVIRR